MSSSPRRVVLAAALAGVVGIGIGLAQWNRTPASTLSVESLTEPAAPPTTRPAEHVADSPCGTTRTVTRGYGQVIVGRRLEALAPAVGQLIIIDPSNGAGPLRLRVERRNGPGRMYFDDFGRPSPTTILYAHAQRTSPGWPGHWGAEVTLTGPGCWHLHIRGKGIDDRLVFPVDRGDWRRGWRPQQAVRRGRPHP